MDIWELMEKEAREKGYTPEAAEEIIGIPRKGRQHKIRQIKRTPELWEYAVQKHEAERAGPHYDLRLGDPRTRKGHSWAIRYWPEPGERRLAVRQSTHSLPYFDWEGEIPSGYGKGIVALHDRGKATIHRASNESVHFGRGKDKYVLVQTGKDSDKWLLINATRA